MFAGRGESARSANQKEMIDRSRKSESINRQNPIVLYLDTIIFLFIFTKKNHMKLQRKE